MLIIDIKHNCINQNWKSLIHPTQSNERNYATLINMCGNWIQLSKKVLSHIIFIHFANDFPPTKKKKKTNERLGKCIFLWVVGNTRFNLDVGETKFIAVMAMSDPFPNHKLEEI